MIFTFVQKWEGTGAIVQEVPVCPFQICEMKNKDIKQTLAMFLVPELKKSWRLVIDWLWFPILCKTINWDGESVV